MIVHWTFPVRWLHAHTYTSKPSPPFLGRCLIVSQLVSDRVSTNASLALEGLEACEDWDARLVITLV